MIFAGAGVAAYALTLIATVPASMAVSRSRSVVARAGTIWNGEAALAGGDRLSWRWAPLRSLTSLGFAVDWQATGTETDLVGRAVLYPSSVRLDHVAGIAGASLLPALAPDLAFTCALSARVEVARLAIGGGAPAGEAVLYSAPGRCRPAGGGPETMVPPLVLTAVPVTGGATLMTVVPRDQRRRILVRAELTAEKRIGVEVTPDGARVLPFAVPTESGPLSFETEL